jgi:hypothetical protein
VIHGPSGSCKYDGNSRRRLSSIPSKKDFDAPKANYRVIEHPGGVHAFPEATETRQEVQPTDANVDQEAKAEAARIRFSG